MKALTIRQPWADAVLEPGGKDVENRGGGFPRGYRGTLLVHAALAMSDRGLHDSRIRGLWPDFGDHAWILGALIGAVDAIDAHLDVGCCKPWGESEYAEASGVVRRSITHLVLGNPRTFDQPIRCPGRLGLWTPSDDLVDDIDDALAACTEGSQ